MTSFFKSKAERFKKNSGFTLVELLLVLTIIVFLIAIVSINFMDMRKKQRDIKGKADLRQIVNALELRYNDLGYYPTSLPTPFSCATDLCGEQILPVNEDLQIYLNPIPTGNGVRQYFWYREGNNRPQKFCLYFQLELDPTRYFTCSNYGCVIETNTRCLGF